MKTADELKQELIADLDEVKRYQSEGDLETAIKLAREMESKITEYQLAAAFEREQFQEVIQNSVPVGKNFTIIDDNNSTAPKMGKSGAKYHKAFLNAVRRRDFQNGYLQESALPKGGYLLPVSMHDRIISALEEENVMRQISTVITTESEHRIVIVASKPQAYWVGEGQDVSLTNETFGQVTLDAHKVATAIVTTNELLQDSYYDLENHLCFEFGKALARTEEDAFLNGSGEDNQPKGLLPQMQTSASSFITTQGSEITADDLITLCYTLRSPYRKKACWIMNDTTIAQVRKLKDATQNFIWQPCLTAEQPPTLLGFPVYSSSFMPTSAAGNVAVLFGDFSYFIIGDRGQMVFQPLRELYALSGKTAFLMLKRTDCVLTNNEAVRGLKIKE